MTQRQPYNDLAHIKRVLNAINPDMDWLAEQVPALIEEIEFLRYSLSEKQDDSDLVLAQLIVRRTWY